MNTVHKNTFVLTAMYSNPCSLGKRKRSKTAKELQSNNIKNQHFTVDHWTILYMLFKASIKK